MKTSRLNLILSLILISSFGFYVMFLSGDSSFSYKNSANEKKMAVLKNENQTLRLELARLASAKRVENLALDKAMTPAGAMAYLESPVGREEIASR